MANLPTRNQNPGDLKDPATGTFRKFSSPQEGFTALKNDLTAKITGNTRTGLNGNSSLTDFASKYAPSSDGNDSVGYAKKLAVKLGVTPETSIGSLSNRLDDFASAIAGNEGYQGGNQVLGESESVAPAQSIATGGFKPLTPQQYQKARGAGFSAQQILENEKIRKGQGSTQTPAGQPNSNGFVTSAGLPDKPTTPDSQNQPGFLQSLAQGIAHPFLEGASTIGALGAQVLGNDQASQDISNKGVDYGYFGNAKPVGAGFDVTKGPIANAAPLADVASTGAQVAGDIVTAQGIGGLLGKLLPKGGSAVNAVAPIVQDYLGQSGLTAEKFLATDPEGQYNAIQNALQAAANNKDYLGLTARGSSLASDRLILQKAFEEIAPKVLTENGVGSFAELHPALARLGTASGGALKTLLKVGGLGGAIGLGGGIMDRLIPRK